MKTLSIQRVGKQNKKNKDHLRAKNISGSIKKIKPLQQKALLFPQIN